jgi:hypothetical protein
VDIGPLLGRFEHHREELLPRHKYLKRQLRFMGFAGLIIAGSLGVGVLGYHCFESLGWLDSLLNASMILGGMGPVDPVKTDAGKVFASFYALFSGVVFLVVVGVAFAPAFHRFLHKFHLEMEPEHRPRQRPPSTPTQP